jgi:hypothetical protein
MFDTLADIAEPRVEKTPSAHSAVVPAQEARDAILKAFPYEGDLRVRHLWSTGGFSRFRANWFRQVEGEMKIVTSMFVGVTRTVDGLVVQDETALK